MSGREAAEAKLAAMVAPEPDPCTTSRVLSRLTFAPGDVPSDCERCDGPRATWRNRLYLRGELIVDDEICATCYRELARRDGEFLTGGAA